MKYTAVVVIATLLGAAWAQEVSVVRSEQENKGDGTFSWLSELSDGSKLEQSGYVKDGPDPEKPIQVIQGQYSYISPEGETINVKYIADENGFQPTGEHLPTSPPIPEAIQKSLDIILRNADAQTAASYNNQVRRPAPPSRGFSSPRRG